MKANLKTIVAMVFVLMLLIVFIWPACSSPSRYILGVPITHKEKMSDQALKIQLTRGEIKNMYRLIALGATPENDSLGADPWGNEYHYIVIPGKYDAPPKSNTHGNLWREFICPLYQCPQHGCRQSTSDARRHRIHLVKRTEREERLSPG